MRKRRPREQSPAVLRQFEALLRHLTSAGGTETFATIPLRTRRVVVTEAEIRRAVMQAAERDCTRGVRTV